MTGATGFVGTQVLAVLAREDWVVHGVRRGSTFTSEELAGPITWHVRDLRDPAAGASLIDRVRPTHVLHLAWNAEHGTYWTAADNDAWADATIVLAQALAESGGQRFVAAGTCAEYDWRNLTSPCLEDQTPLAPQTLYGQAKLRAGLGVLKIAAERGLSAAWGRLFFPYGPGEDPRRLIPSVVHALRTGARAKVSEGTQVRDFLHVSDAARAFVALLTHPLTGAVNIGSGIPVTVRALVEALARLAGRPEAVDFGAVPMQAGEPPMIVADVTRITSTGWRPHIPLDVGLADLR